MIDYSYLRRVEIMEDGDRNLIISLFDIQDDGPQYVIPVQLKDELLRQLWEAYGG